MADLKCKCSTPYGIGHVIVNCTKRTCEECCPRTLIEEVEERFDNGNNPSDPRSFGFNNKYDGRVRGGLKTPQAFDKRNSIVGREFNIFDSNARQNNFVKNGSMNATQNQGFNVNPNRSNYRQQKVVKLHPLDVLRQKRVMGRTVYDPVTNVYKIDDLRPRGYDEVGKALCWGSCKIKKPWWLFGLGGGGVKCKCNKAGDGCACDGCLDSAKC